ncbi:MAG: DUF2752 domain-containing protein [Bacteroidota bacterium]
MSAVVSWLEQHMLSCPYKNALGIDCPGCGMQRSFIALLKGDFAESFHLYPALIPIMVTIVVLIIHLKMKLKNGARLVKYAYMFSISVVLIHYTYKMTVMGGHVH